MALVKVRFKNGPSKGKTSEVSERWLSRWPDDFERVEDAEGTPPGNASRSDWEDYALANGRTAEEIEKLNRDGIRDLFQTPAPNQGTDPTEPSDGK